MQSTGVGKLLLELMRWFREVCEGKLRGRDDQTSGGRLVSVSQSIPHASVQQDAQRMCYILCAPVT